MIVYIYFRVFTQYVEKYKQLLNIICEEHKLNHYYYHIITAVFA